MPSNAHDPWAALRYGNFRLFISVRLLTTLLTQAQAVVVSYQLYEITNDPLALGLIGLVEAVPALTVALYAGHVADRYHRKRIVLLSFAMIFLTTLILYLYSLEFAQWHARLGTAPIYLAIFFTGLARGFISPANFALMSQLIPRAIYLNATTWNSSVWQLGTIIGPALGGVLIGAMGATNSYLVVIGILAVAAILFSFLQNVPPPAYTSTETLVTRIRSGLQFVFGNKVLLSLITLDLFAVLFGGAEALFPVFARDIIANNNPEETFGLLRSAPAVGSALMALVLTFAPPMKHAGRNMLLAVAGFGLSMIFFALSQHLWLALFFLFLSGVFDNISVVVRSTMLQLLTPDDMRGRVSSVNSMFLSSSNEIGAFESGVTARWLGTVTSVVFGGIMTMVVVGFTNWRVPRLKRMDMQEYSR
ncbi:Predicted arabinose efflux permease, MFS family [Catalinimonas alkaloidigena]|uniref:Predicted arabinose efflux permease, MFS family n=1 Tax=Catalinimonas alkaloidigena TaxID=1075417 RepID=A0A1G8XLW7_9BACT|nr:MFS transporter [Catalinimonas alkaloidigena]SDJ91642.1 Predicted arabinose efflux permease, MFS family [Catalinimonas alkaloidigena]